MNSLKDEITAASNNHFIKGNFNRDDLIHYGEQAATNTEKISQFFQYYFINIFKYGFKEAETKREDYFINKSVAIIQDINLKELQNNITDMSPQEIMQYLVVELKQGVIVKKDSSQWDSILSLHKLYRFLAETRKDLELEHHWLKDFANKDDLGPHLELIDPIRHQKQVSSLLELDALQRTAPTPYFNNLLTFILDSGKLRDITDEKLNKFKLCLELDRNLSSYSKEERLEKTKSLFTMLETIENNKGLKGLADRKTFQNFLSQNFALQDLLLQLPLAPVETMLEIQNLYSKISPLPTDLAFSKTADEIIQKLNDELPENKQATLAKRLGEEFAKSYASLSEIDRATIESSVATLRKIEEDYRLNGKSQDFLQNMKKAVGNGFNNPTQFAMVFEKLQSPDLLHPLPLYLMRRLGEERRKFLNLGIPPKQVLEFQQKALQEAETVARDWMTQLKEGIKEGTGKIDINEKIQATVISFNKAQLEKAKQEWISSYGQDFADSFLITLGSEVENGHIHYKEKQITNLEEVDKLFAQFNAHQLKSQYGHSLISHAMHYLLSPAGKALVNNNPNFLKQEWPALLKNFEKVRQRFFDQGVNPVEFEEALNRFLTQSPPASVESDNWLLLNAKPLEEFSTSLQSQLTNKQLNEMTQTHGELFVESLKDYLKGYEPTVLEGKRSLKESFFYTVPFSDQVYLLIPYLLTKFEPIKALDKEIIKSSLLIDPVTPQNLIIRFNNLNQLKELGKEYHPNSREMDLVKEFIHNLNPPYLMDLNLDRRNLKGAEKSKDREQQEIVQESIRQLVKFCLKEINESQVYSTHLLSQAMAELLKQKGNSQDPPVKRLKTVADECDAFFNSDIKKDFHSICFQLSVKEMAKEACEAQSQVYSPKVALFVKGLLARFSKQEEGIQSQQAAKYIKHFIQFAVTLSLTTEADNFTIYNELLLVSKHNVLFNVKKINERTKDSKKPLEIPSDVKEELINKLKLKSGLKTSESNATIRAIQNNPFAIVQAFFPKFIEEVLAPEDKDKAADVRKSLIHLAPLFNQSIFVRTGVDMLSDLSKYFHFVAEDSTDDVKKHIVESIKGFNQLNIEEIAKLGNRDKIRQTLNNKKLGIWMSVINGIAEGLFDAHAKIHAPNADMEKLAKDDSFVDFIHNTLPKIADDRETIQKWITEKKLNFFIPIIRKLGGGWIADQILKRYISYKLDKVEFLDKPTKKLAAESMKAIIAAALLASPTLIKNHKINDYLAFFDRLNQIMKKNSAPNQEELIIEIMKVVQQLTKEFEIYGPILEEALNQTVAQAAS